jgi:hypothetical protein
LSLILPIIASSLVCLMPVAIYLLFLAHLNHRRSPTMLSGQWDFTYLLLGLSGFLLTGGPLLLVTLDSAWRNFAFNGTFGRLREAWHGSGAAGSTIVGGYLVAMAALIGFFMNLRRKVTVIYNIDPVSLQGMLTAAVDARDLGWRSVLGGIEISAGKFRTALVLIDTFPTARHATLRWVDSDPLLRRDVETELASAMRLTQSPVNPFGGWLLTTAVATFTTMLLCMIYLIWTVFTNHKI